MSTAIQEQIIRGLFKMQTDAGELKKLMTSIHPVAAETDQYKKISGLEQELILLQTSVRRMKM